MTRSHAGPDRLAEHLARLGHLPGGVVHRALVAIAVAHRLDARGRCRTCTRRRWPTVRLAAGRAPASPGGRWSGRDRSGDCHTRRILRAAIRDTAARQTGENQR